MLKRGRGRPPVPDSEARRNRVGLNLTDGEFAGLLSARRSDETISGAAVRLLFYEPFEPEPEEAP
jgi:hypothetical protein